MYFGIKCYSKLVVFTCLTLLSTTVFSSDPTPSVVKILAGNKVGTGFVWQGKNQKYIATSLHTLVGETRIFYDRKSASTQLQVYKADLESDLALLIPTQGTLTLPALALGSDTQPKRQNRYYIYGFPAGVKVAQGDSIEFSRTTHNLPMASVLPNDVLKDVTASGFPQSSVKILRVSSGITPGHSGAPIIDDATQEVIGIGAGGLSKKGFRRVNWAIPAADYLTNIELYAQPVDVSRMQSASSEYKHSVTTSSADSELQAGAGKYYHIYQVSMLELVYSLHEEGILADDEAAIVAFNKVITDAEEKGYSAETTMIDIYQHQETGGLIYMPASVIFVGGEGMLLASNQSGNVSVYMQTYTAETKADAFLEKEVFAAVMQEHNGWEWVLEPEHSLDSPYDNPEAGEWENWQNFYYASGTNEQSNLELNLSIMYGEGYADFFGYALVSEKSPMHTQQDSALIHQLTVCLELSGFVML